MVVRGSKRKWKVLQSFICVMSILSVLIFKMQTVKCYASSSDQPIKIGAYIQLLVKALKLDTKYSSLEACISIATNEGILKPQEFKDYTANLTREDCALLTNRAEKILFKSQINSQLYDVIINKKRISDLSKIKKTKRQDVVELFSKGIMVGDSNGKCSQSRKFQPSKEVTVKEAKQIISSMSNKDKRRKLSPDGQLIRTTNLPFNAREFEYILESFPNDFYTMKFEFETVKSSADMIELEKYACPVQYRNQRFINATHNGTVEEFQDMVDKYSADWIKKVEQNLLCRLNVNYKNVDSSWSNSLTKTYWSFGTYAHDEEIKNINDYIKFSKKNKVVLKASKVVVEPSTLYSGTDSDYCRAYIKFMLVSANNNVDKDKVIYSSYVRSKLKKIKVGLWNELYVDIGIGSLNGNTYGDDYGVNFDSISDYNMEQKINVLKVKFNSKPSRDFPSGYYYFG